MGKKTEIAYFIGNKKIKVLQRSVKGRVEWTEVCETQNGVETCVLYVDGFVIGKKQKGGKNE